MKRVFVFLLGMIAGALLFAGISYMIVYRPWLDSDSEIMDNYIPGLTMFEEPGDVLPYKSFEVLQVLYNGNALMHASEFTNETRFINCPIVYVFSPKTGGYYDEQVIRLPKDKDLRIVGTYHYNTKSGDSKTVPVVALYDIIRE